MWATKRRTCISWTRTLTSASPQLVADDGYSKMKKRPSPRCHLAMSRDEERSLRAARILECARASMLLRWLKFCRVEKAVHGGERTTKSGRNSQSASHIFSSPPSVSASQSVKRSMDKRDPGARPRASEADSGGLKTSVRGSPLKST